MAENRELEWLERDHRSAEVAARVGDDRLSVTLEFDGVDIVRASSEMRLRRVGKRFVPTPWTGEYAGYEILGEMRIPTRAEVYWDLDEGRFVYWRGTVVSAEVLSDPTGP